MLINKDVKQKNMADTNLQITIRVLDKFSTQFKKAGAQLKTMGKQAEAAGRTLSTRLTAPIALIGTFAIKAGADFSKGMARVKAITAATDDQFKQLTETAKELGRTTQFTAKDVADAMGFMAQAGFDTATILEAIPATLNLAASAALDMASAADIVTNVMAGFGFEADELDGAVDVLAKAFTSANTDLSQLGDAMKFAGPVANAMGATFEQTTGALALMGNAGFQGTLAGTALRGAMVRLASPTNTAAKIIQRVGLKAFDAKGKILPFTEIVKQLEGAGLSAAESMEVFGLRAGPAMLALVEQGSGALEELITKLENSGGTAEQIAKVQMEGLHGQLIRLKSAWEGFGIAITNSVLPILSPLIERITVMLGKFSKLSPKIQATIIIIAILAAALGPLLIFFGLFAQGIAAVSAAIGFALPIIGTIIGLLFSWIGVIAVVVAAVVVLGIAIFKNWEKIKLVTINTWTTISNFIKNITSVIVGFFSSAWNKTKQVTMTTWNSIASFFVNIWDKITGTFFSSVEKVKDAFRAISEIDLETITIFLENLENKILDSLSNTENDIKVWSKNTGTIISDGVKNWWISVQDSLGNIAISLADWFGETLGSVKKWFKDTDDSFTEGGKNWWLSIQDTLGNIAISLADWFGETLGKIKEWWSNMGKESIEVFSETVGTTIEEQKPSMLGRIADALASITIALPALLAVGFIRLGFKIIKFIITGILQKIPELIKIFVDDILPKIRDTILGWKDDFVSWGKDLAKSLWEGFKAIPSNIGNFVKGKIPNISIPSPNFSAAQIDTGVRGFATGGIVKKPMLGMVGEAGPEAIIPLNKTGGFGTTININGGTFLSENAAEQIGDMIIGRLKQQVRI